MLIPSISTNCKAFGKFSNIVICICLFILAALISGCGAIHNTGLPYTGAVQFGMASWYGEDFDGCVTTSGNEYDMEKFTAAHRTLPFGTLVKVTNLDNEKTVVVSINDRGPWKPSRVIDLSYASAQEVGMVESGVARVRLDVIDRQIDRQVGMASWYGQKFHGRTTASGELFNMNKFTAAHNLLPFGTYVRITNMENGEMVTVKINDRMPQSKGRVINLSRQAARRLGIMKPGTVQVALEVVKTANST